MSQASVSLVCKITFALTLAFLFRFATATGTHISVGQILVHSSVQLPVIVTVDDADTSREPPKAGGVHSGADEIRIIKIKSEGLTKLNYSSSNTGGSVFWHMSPS